MTLGVLSLPSLGWTESMTDANRETEPEPWLEAKKKKAKKSKTTSGKKKSAGEGGNTDWQEMA